MFRPVKMAKVNILLMSKHVTEITRVLGQRGLIHLVDAVNQSGGRLLSEVDQEQDEKAIYNALSRCERLMEGLGVDQSAELPDRQESMSLEDISAMIMRIYTKFHEQEETIDKILRETGVLDKERSAIAAFPLQQVSLDALRNLSHFFMVTGRLASSIIPRVTMELGERAVVVPADGREGNVLVLCSNKNHWAVMDDLQRFGFVAAEAPEQVSGSAEEAVHERDDELGKLHSQLNECRFNVLKLSEEYGGVLLMMHSQLKGLIAVRQAQKHFGKVANLYCISGWTPSSEVDTIRDIVKETTGGTGLVEVIEADDDALVKAGLETVPVKFKGGTLLRPFQMIITNFGTPLYNELDPTIFVGITFVLLFGFMFGDIGQGLVLALLGLWLKLSKSPKLDDTMHDAGVLLTACGTSAVVFGFLYGSFFGYENHAFLKPIWLSPLDQNDIGKLLLTAVGVGIIFSSVAIIINIINHFIAKKYYEGVFERFGLLGLLFYWFALGAGIWVIKTKNFPIWAGVLVGIPLLLLFLGGPIKHFAEKCRHHGKGEQESFFNVFLESCIELMETFTGYISGTVSFVRVGAFAISHAALCLAVFSIVKMIHTSNMRGGFIVSAIVIILGNILVIAFEGMVAMIQGVRLEYYELFSRYFSGGGIEYKPFQIDNNNTNDTTTNNENKGER
ncbi:MAG: hypothetical protein IKP00_12925 [Victivallales bacterium]|nr:hypothetical protein [Victivallales bacterium]